MLFPINKYSAFAFSISLQPSTPFTTLSYSIVFLLGSAFLNYPAMVYLLPIILHISRCHPTSSLSFEPLICGVPQGSVLGPILFNLYTTPLSTLTRVSSISHLFYANDIQLFISFIPKNVPTAICDLESTISLISSWMSSNYLTLNPSKTESLLIGLPQQTSKIINPSLLSLSHNPFLPLPQLGT